MDLEWTIFERLSDGGGSGENERMAKDPSFTARYFPVLCGTALLRVLHDHS